MGAEMSGQKTYYLGTNSGTFKERQMMPRAENELHQEAFFAAYVHQPTSEEIMAVTAKIKQSRNLTPEETAAMIKARAEYLSKALASQA